MKNRSQTVTVDRGIAFLSRSQLDHGEFKTCAWSSAALMNFGHADHCAQRGIVCLLKPQDVRGSWNCATFFRGFDHVCCSAELTSALALEALNIFDTIIES